MPQGQVTQDVRVQKVGWHFCDSTIRDGSERSRSPATLERGLLADDGSGPDVTDHALVDRDFEIAVKYDSDGGSLLRLTEQEFAYSKGADLRTNIAFHDLFRQGALQLGLRF